MSDINSVIKIMADSGQISHHRRRRTTLYGWIAAAIIGLGGWYFIWLVAQAIIEMGGK